jgi:hypothetical protein
MQVWPFPGALTNPNVESLEAALQRLPLPTPSARPRIFRYQSFQVVPNETGQGGVSFHRDLPNPLY